MDLSRLVIYELYVDAFATNFRGLKDKLPYLSDLGVSVLWILPHYPSPFIDGGYDVSNYKAVRYELGDTEEFEVFVKEAISRKMIVMIDLVLNHTSSRHPWFMDARSSKRSAKREWYLWSADRFRFAEAKNAFPHLKASNWILNQDTNDYYFATFYPQQPDLNWDNEEVFDAFTDCMRFWVNRGVGGFRLDAISHLIKRENSESVNCPEIHTMVKKFRSWVDTNAPETLLLAEAGGTHQEMYAYFGEGDECHLVNNFALPAVMMVRQFLGDDALYNQLVFQSRHVPQGCAWALPLRNHDALSLTLLPIETRDKILNSIDPYFDFSFVPHESVSMRLASIISDESVRKKMFSDIFALSGVPIIYYGSEIGMKNTVLTKHPSDTRVYIRGQFDWETAYFVQKLDTSLYRHIQVLIREKSKSSRSCPSFYSSSPPFGP